MFNVRSTALAMATVGVLAVAACGGSGSSAQPVTIDLQVTGTTMKPNQVTAHQGDKVTVNVTADKQEGIHLHGYNLLFEAKPGEKVTKTFTADKTGNFPIEIEESSTPLGELDVYPR